MEKGVVAKHHYLLYRHSKMVGLGQILVEAIAGTVPPVWKLASPMENLHQRQRWPTPTVTSKIDNPLTLRIIICSALVLLTVFSFYVKAHREASAREVNLPSLQCPSRALQRSSETFSPFSLWRACQATAALF